MKVSDLMRTNLIKVRPQAHIGHVLIWYNGMTNTSRNTYVVDDKGGLLGVVTIFDFLYMIVPQPVITASLEGSVQGRDGLLRTLRRNMAAIADTEVGSIMDTRFPMARADDLFVTAHALIMERRANAVPVLDAKGLLVGEISRRMILGFLVQNL
ncbi:CBS domain-containing protein [Desulfolutivibrio sulfoxidireducens]|uniref:CBS domain-containing protein n=1 Tax=Desulfolutivibrio sulfoxidireducens TaxID=2773299 RepID=UPI00159DA862|nr:CBS domain-containing protein [Desulfolutivibrio sulfoxidireducens]QLA16809.1 CBS domain-containing protein [Desulfolutivibrio sulfoxidireducens]QLA20374.1 CBS domain-containing protein [Desulfolutivibrio sulfoxidireducens]